MPDREPADGAAAAPAPDKPAAKDRPHYHGHRERMRARVLDSGAETLRDYEILEYLLYGVRPNGDTKPLAKALLARFGSLPAVLAADAERLKEVKGIGPAAIAIFKVNREVGRRLARQIAPKDQTVISSWDRLLAYCRVALADETVERFHLLFLDKKNKLIRDETQSRGTVDHTPVYAREVVKRALELDASSIILVHNHPSGDPTPSKADIQMTRQIAEAAGKLGIQVHDHVIITRYAHTSFKKVGLL
jgi:DNA repair protein RadC